MVVEEDVAVVVVGRSTVVFAVAAEVVRDRDQVGRLEPDLLAVAQRADPAPGRRVEPQELEDLEVERGAVA